ncbi:MAG TPA: hypothetical protein PK050_08990 [Hyphomonadaceae bacterium]|nr:hypothetical protein [Hyphomonadaceae bacterium]
MLGRALTLAMLTGLAAPAALADSSGVQRTWLERVAISAADKNCNLFNEGERLALQSGIYQAQGELLRANKTIAEMQKLEAEVSAHARSLGCAHPSVVEVAATVRSSYRQFAKTSYLEYPTPRSTWAASRSGHDKWAVAQTDKTTDTVFGLRRVKDDLKLAISMPAKGLMPQTVQLVMRDADKMPEAWLGSITGATKELAPPPRSIARIEWAAEIRKGNDAVGAPIWVFYFNAAALTRLEALDPRESFRLDFVPPQRAKDQTVKSVAFEVGDIRAAHAFSQIPPPEYPAATQTAAAAAH